MSALTDTGITNLANLTARLDPGGNIARTANVLSKMNPILQDIPWMEGNLQTGHQINQTVNSLPSATWRVANTGVEKTKVETASYVESCGILEDITQIDERIVELNGGREYRASEDDLKLEAFSQQFATSLFYESVSTNAERMHGLAPRYPATTGYTSSSYTKAGTNGGTNSRSIWLISWGDRKVYCTYPKGTKAGLERNDKGLSLVYDSNSKPYYAWVTQFVWRVGLVIEDYRYVVRFQWDPEDAEMATDERGLYMGMLDMINLIHEPGKAIFYMDRTSKGRLDAQLAANDARYMTLLNDGGRRLNAFNECPIRLEEALVAETAIS